MEELLRNLNFWSVIGTFLAVLAALVIAVWGDWLKTIFFKPKLEILYDHKWPDVLLIPYNEKHNVFLYNNLDKSRFDLCYYFRFRVKNVGNRPANNVEVIVKSISIKEKDDKFELYQKFIPLNLSWSFENGKKNLDRLNPGIEKHCDLGFVSHPQHKQILQLIEKNNRAEIPFKSDNSILFNISFVVKPKIVQSYLLPPGHYRIQLNCFASNTNITSNVFELKFTETWLDDIEKMRKVFHLEKIK